MNLVRLSESGKVEKLTAAQGCAEREPAYALAKSALVYVSNCSSLGNARNIWQFDLETRASRPRTAGLMRDEEPDVSPDGNWIVYTSWPGDVSSIWKMPMAGGTPQQVSRIQAGHPAVSPDSKSVLCLIRESYDGRYRYAILSLANGNVEKELWDLPVTDAPARWEPDGEAIDFLDAERTRIWRKPIMDGPAVPIIETTNDPITAFSWNSNGNKLAFTTVHTSNDVVLFHRKANR
jgi:Tol biopolymer transport system component